MEEELLQYCISNHINSYFLSNEEKSGIIEIIKQKYMRDPKAHSWSLFETLKSEEGIGVCDNEAWRWLKNYIAEKEIIVFFDINSDMVYIENGDSFLAFYDEIGKEEFYMIDFEGSFLLGNNHSHCLFTLGDAADWLEGFSEYKKYRGL